MYESVFEVHVDEKCPYDEVKFALDLSKNFEMRAPCCVQAPVVER